MTRQEADGTPAQAASAEAAAARHLLHLPRPGRRESGLPSPVLKFAWQRRQTYIFELDIIGLTPGSPAGRAATYSAWVWRSLSAEAAVSAGLAAVWVGGGLLGFGGGAGAEGRGAMAILLVAAPAPEGVGRSRGGPIFP